MHAARPESDDVISQDLDDLMRSWRQSIHRRPGLGFAVEETAGFVASQLAAFGFDEIHDGVGGTGVVGVLRAGDSTTSIGLRADMDALPIEEAGSPPYRSEVSGAFHGCGHDGHTAMLLGAARRLSSDRQFDGTVCFVFQPDEENGRGAQAMIDDGLFEIAPMDAIFGLHNRPGLPVGQFESRPGPMMSSEDLFEITVHGRGGHASTPHLHVDPVVTAAQIITALQTVVARSVPPSDVAVLSVTEIETDGARNIVPSNVTIKGDCRAFSSTTQEILERRIRDIASDTAAGHGATVTVDYRNEFVPLVNTEAEFEAAMAAARSLVGVENVNPACELITGSEDFARYLAHVPGCFVDMGNGIDHPYATSLHNPGYDFNDDALTTGAGFWVTLVEQQLRTR